MSNIVRLNGQPLGLGEQLGSGGEGSVYRITSDANHVAKIYHKPVDREKAAKLITMSRLASRSLAHIAAWPQETIHDASSRAIVGVIIPFIGQATEIHELYNPAHRKQSFPKFDWRHLVRVARNCASAFATLHKAGVIVGDVNQGNIFVNKDATVRLIDCDSFQIRNSQHVFRCLVGVPHYTPPELQSSRFCDVDRTANHDAFGLAVMIFHLLFIGRHPFMGRYTGRGEMPTVERAIQEYRFAFGRQHQRFDMEPPPHSLLKEDVSDTIFNLFEAAFSTNAASGRSRPPAEHWSVALEHLEQQLSKCSVDPGHYYLLKRSCPWCRIQLGGGPNFFITASMDVVLARVVSFDLHACWRKIDAIPSPVSTLAKMTVNSAAVTPKAVEVVESPEQLLKRVFGIIGLASFLLGFICAIFSTTLMIGLLGVASISAILCGIFRMLDPNTKELQNRKATLRDSEQRLNAFNSRLHRLQQGALESFLQEKRKLADARARYEASMRDEQREKDELKRTIRERQLDDYLSRQFIDKAKIQGIGPQRTATLEYYGIETAADVSSSAVERIPGFGVDLTAKLVAWRRVLESKFRFDPSIGVPKATLAALINKWSTYRRSLEQQLSTGAVRLQRIKSSGEEGLAAKNRERLLLETEVLQAEADFKALKRIQHWF